MQTHIESDGDEIVFSVPVRVSRRELKELLDSELPLDSFKSHDRQQMGKGSLLDAAKRLVAFEHSRKAMPGIGGLFGDPAWMILLDLYIRGLEEKTTSVSSATLASGSPATTGLRYVSLLASSGHIIRSQHPHDERSVHVKLSSETRRAISQILENAAF